MPNKNHRTHKITECNNLGEDIAHIGMICIQLALAIVLAWIGAMKFTGYEANAIQGLVSSSPLTSWLYKVFSVQGTSQLIGTIEIAAALLILIGIKFPQIALLGAIGAALTFLITASFLFTAPVTEASLGGFPALSVLPGQFLLKDIALLAAAIFLIGNALKRIARTWTI